MEGLKFLRQWLVVPLWLAGLSGCGWFGAQTENGVDVEEDIAEATEPVPVPTPAPAPSLPAGPGRQAPPGIKPGDRFPLMKTVEQTLRQRSAQGWVVSRSTLELLLSVTVAEVHEPIQKGAPADLHAGQKRLQVTYHRVKFAQELPEQPRVEYDSAAPTSAPPPGAQAYQGLKENGFDFWLTADHQLADVTGFEEFINRCLKDVPPESRSKVRAALAVATPAEGVATFIDDSIGILPPTAVHGSETWVRDRRIAEPVPLQISTEYALRRLTPEVAEIEIHGMISPAANGPQVAAERGVEVAVRGGQSMGHCLLDRRSGLPLESHVQQMLEMNVRLADGSAFDQYKSTLTTIKAFPEHASPPPTRDGAASASPPARISLADSPDRPSEPAGLSRRKPGGTDN